MVRGLAIEGPRPARWQSAARSAGVAIRSAPHLPMARLSHLIALRTAMRASEVLSLSAGNVGLDRRVATVQHKTQRLTGRPRQVPLSKPAIRLLRQLDPAGFTLTSASLGALFRKATRALLIQDLHFHDSRAEALTRFSRKVDVMSLARVSGHKDLRTRMDHYYRQSIRPRAGEHQRCVSQLSVAQSSAYRQPRLSIRKARVVH
jgi:integrase